MAARDPGGFMERAATLDRDGFVVWRDMLPHDAIDRHLAAYTRLASELGIDGPDGITAIPRERWPDLHRAREKFHRESEEAVHLWMRPDLMTSLA